MSEEPPVPRGVDMTVPSIARVYDYMIGGKDNFAVDRQVADMALRIAPQAPVTGRANREFLQRVVRHLGRDAGIDQFLDLGSGLPTQGNVHEIAQQVIPDARTVYVDIDPIVLSHSLALLRKDRSTAIVQADVREPETILNHPEVARLIDFDRPVGLLMIAILHHLNDAEDPRGIAARFVKALPAGSYIAISHFLNPGPAHPELAEQSLASEKLFNEHLGTGRWRTREEVLGFFCGHELIEPGLVPLPQWHPYLTGDRLVPVLEPESIHHSFVGGVARV
jgi:hypothetical protein